MADRQGVLVIGEVANGKLNPSSTEMLAHGRKLADSLKEPLSIALLGQDLGAAPKEAIAFGADKVHAVTDPLLKEYQVDAYLAAITKVAQQHTPRVVLLAKGPIGSEVGPRLAFRLDTAVIQDCLEVRIDAEKKLVGNRPVYGGNCMATITSLGEPMMAIVRPKTGDPLARNDSRHGEVVAFSPRLEASVIKSRVVERVEKAQEGVRLEDAAIVVSGGRGLGSAAPFTNEIKDLADLLGAAIGASRAVVDSGWISHDHQVGLTGKTIAPNLYIMVGISGASQHMAGCSAAKVIVAINRDSDAVIFNDARYGVAGDWKKVLPAFIQQIRAMK
ncbi:MAG: electron transfer flavoprotein subunit alpha/FixB family protein [Dehalococcoidia bacterium]|nr:electron transfer flavoprotein subunit alpha/FixB family protein [Dehalococcoidia bacterium]